MVLGGFETVFHDCAVGVAHLQEVINADETTPLPVDCAGVLNQPFFDEGGVDGNHCAIGKGHILDEADVIPSGGTGCTAFCAGVAGKVSVAEVGTDQFHWVDVECIGNFYQRFELGFFYAAV